MERNELPFGMSPEYSLGRYEKYFKSTFVFIGKNFRVIGTLDIDAEESEFIDMFDKTIASVYGLRTNDDFEDILLYNDITFNKESLFLSDKGVNFEIELIENSNPYIADIIMNDNMISFRKTNIQGHSFVTVQAIIPDTDITVRRSFYVYNMSTNLENFEYSTIEESPVYYYFTDTGLWTLSNDQSYNESTSLISPIIGDNRTSIVNTRINLTEPGVITFAYRTSSQLDYDMLYFMIDGAVINPTGFSGDSGWKLFSSTIRSGIHTVSWKYQKNYYLSSYEDCVWIDMISFPEKTEFLPQFDMKSVTPADINIDISPNPFNPVTRISYEITQSMKAEIAVYDIYGKKVAEIFKGHIKPGIHNFDFNGSNLSSGIYYNIFKTPDFVKTSKMVLTK